MTISNDPAPPSRFERFGLNPWLQRFLTIIAGTVVAVIAWTVLEHFMHILILLLASFLFAYLAGPLVDKIEKRGLPRILGILLLYLLILGGLAVAGILLIGPLTNQLQALTKTLPTLFNSQNGAPLAIDDFLKQYGIPISFTDLRNQVATYLASASDSLLGGTLAVVSGLVTFVTDVFLILAITFYLLLDGKNMHNAGLRFLSETARQRWFFIEATLNRVLGGYIRGQIIVAATVGLAAGLGCALLGVPYPLVIGLLAFLFEFIPMLGPVLGMIPAVVIALFQPMPLVWWVIIYFIVLQQVESNVIVPRVSGHAVGLHPLGALLALLAGFEIGGIGGALLSVPVAGVLYVIALAIYSDLTGQSSLLVDQARPTALRQIIERRPTTPAASIAPATPAIIPPPPATATSALPDDRLTTLAQEQAQLSTAFDEHEAEVATQELKDNATADTAAKS